MTTPADERVAVGLVRGLHGLGGAVRVEVLSDDLDRFAVGSVLFAEGDESPLTIAWSGPAKPGLLVSFAQIGTREAAERLRDRYLVADPAPLPEGSYYWHEVRGLAVSTTEGESLGSVVDVFRAGAGEVYVVRGGDRGEVLVPAVRDVVVELDPPAGRLVVDADVLALPDRPPRRRRRHELTREERKRARQRPRRSRRAPSAEAGGQAATGEPSAEAGGQAATGEPGAAGEPAAAAQPGEADTPPAPDESEA